jgi:hypothetical protein
MWFRRLKVVDPQKKFEIGYFITTHRLGASNLYHVEFLLRGMQQWRGLNNLPKKVQPGCKATVQVIHGEARFQNWDRVPQDVDVPSEHFEKEAVRRSFEEYQRLHKT